MKCNYKKCDGVFHYPLNPEDKQVVTECPIHKTIKSIEKMGIPLREFSDFTHRISNKTKSIESIKSFLDSRYTTLILRGNTGVGKTFLAHCIVSQTFLMGGSCKYVEDVKFMKTTSDMFDRDFKTDARGEILKWKRVDVLVYDDFASRYYTEHGMTVLKDIIDYRQEHKFKTVFTTNKQRNDINFTSAQGRNGEQWNNRIASRLAYNALDIVLIGKDYRRI